MGLGWDGKGGSWVRCRLVGWIVFYVFGGCEL